MAETFRISKLEKFIQKQVTVMEHQQRTIEGVKEQGLMNELINIIQANNTTMYNYTFDLCREFDIEMPYVLGVTPQ